MKFAIALMISLASAQAAGSPDKDALIAKYKNKFAVVLKDGIDTCLHRSPAQVSRYYSDLNDSLEGDTATLAFIGQDGRASNSGRALLCQLDSLHKGEIVMVSGTFVLDGYLRLRLTTISPHAETRGVGAFEHQELNRGDVAVVFMPDQTPDLSKLLRKRSKGPGVASPADRASIETLVAGWLALFDTAEAARMAQLGNTASGAYVHQVKAGMSFAEVEAALGVPETRVDLGEKVLYKYKDSTTVEFHDGKVTDVR